MRWPVLVAVTVAGAVYTLTQGITYPLLALTLEHSGASGTAIGTSAAMTPIGMPRRVEHCPRAEVETAALLLEPREVVNTGAAGGDFTATVEALR